MARVLKFWPLYYWLGLVLLMTVISGLYDEIWLGAFAMNGLRFLFVSLNSYLIFSIIFSNNFFNIYVKFLISFLTVLCFAVLNRFMFGILIYPIFFQDSYTYEFLNIGNIISHSIIFLSALAGFGLIKYYSETKERERINEALVQQKKEAELNFLKAQLHPHFLFNTLNSIYNEVLKKSDLAGELLMRISEMLRFILYECQKDTISLKKEIKLLEDYIELEKVRYGDRLVINQEIEKTLDLSIHIPPLILFALVENCFKHGVSNNITDSFINLKLIRTGNKLEFTTENSINAGSIKEQDYQKGIGLKNIKSQLMLIFGDDFELETINRYDVFICKLSIPING